MQRLTRTKNANCALLCPLFNVCWRIRLTHASAKTNGRQRSGRGDGAHRLNGNENTQGVARGGSHFSKSVRSGAPGWSRTVVVYLVDGTYELFRHYYALPSARDEDGTGGRRCSRSAVVCVGDDLRI